MLSTWLNQKDFAEKIGMAYRTYQSRIEKNDAWKIGELIRLAELNDGEVVVDQSGKKYLVSIQEIAD